MRIPKIYVSEKNIFMICCYLGKDNSMRFQMVANGLQKYADLIELNSDRARFEYAKLSATVYDRALRALGYNPKMLVRCVRGLK